MDALMCVREFLLDNVGHMVYPGQPAFDPATQRWLVPICCRTQRSDVVVGDVELDRDGHILSAPTRGEMLARLGATHATT